MFGDNLFEDLVGYFASTGDQESKVVDFPNFDPALGSRFLNGSEHIFEGNEDFTIIDPFSGVMPVVLDHRFLIRKEERVAFSVNILLDSNVVSYLHQYVADTSGNFRGTQRGIATHKLIRKLVEYAERGWTFNALFYLLEAVSKNDFLAVYPHAASLGKSIKTLQLMDREVFLQTGRIEMGDEKYKAFSTLHHSLSLEAVSASDALHFSTGQLRSQVHVMIQLTYAALLKIVLVSNEKCPARKKLEKIFQFMHEELGVHGSWETLLACLKFRGRAGSFLSAKQDKNKTERALLASAWDLHLLRLPAVLILNEGCEHTSVSYVCTAEKTLQRLGGMRTIRRVYTGRLRLPPLFQLDADLLTQQVGKELAETWIQLSRSMVLNGPLRSPIPEHTLQLLISDLRGQL